MMKKIKFRGKCKDNGEMVYGSLLTLPDEFHYIFSPTTFESKDTDSKHFSVFHDNRSEFPFKAALMIYPVIPESIEQFVGYDTEGNEIYEE